MRCLYCGKKLSLLRKLADGQFCSDAHREAHQRLDEELTMARLATARGGRTAEGSAPRPAARRRASASGIPPFAPLRPQAAAWIDFRRMVPLPVEPAPFSAFHFLPESGLRATLRGMPAPRTAYWDPVAPSGFSGQPLVPVGVAPILPEPAPRVETEPSQEPVRESDPPVQPLLPLPACPSGSTRSVTFQPNPLHRRKLVVIVPHSELGIRPPCPVPAPALHWAPPVQPANLNGAHGCRIVAADPWSSPDVFIPSAWLDLDPPEWVEAPPPMSADTASGEESFAEPPLAPAVRSERHDAAPAAVCLSFRCPAAPLFDGLSSVWPAVSGLRESASAGLVFPAPLGLESNPVAASGPPLTPSAAVCLCPDRPPCAPQPSGALMPAAGRLWPAEPGLRPMAFEPAAAAPGVCAPELELLPADLPTVFPPPPGHDPAPRRLRSVQHLLPLEARAAALPLPPPAAEPASAAWSPPAAAVPAVDLPLQPPPQEVECTEHPEETPDRDLSALGRAVAEEEFWSGETVSFPENPETAALSCGVSAAPDLDAGAPPPACASPEQEPGPGKIPGLCRRLPVLPVRPVDSPRGAAAASAAPVLACWSSLDEQHPALPALQLQLDHADGSGPRRETGKRSAKKKPARPRVRNRFWVQAPSDLKWIAVALPLVLVVVVYSFSGNKPNTPSGNSTMSSAAAVQDAPQAAQPWAKTNALQRFIMRRAGVRLFDDFRSGLGAWQGAPGWAGSWRYGDATFVQPGDLALLSPSIPLQDYTFTFLGQIDRRSLNWVFRARDLENYYSMRIVVTRGGPLPAAVLIRSIVVGGKEREVKTLPIPFPVQADTLYLVRMEVRGQDFTTYIQNQVVDHFSDSRLKSGGVGFFSPRGDRALLRWVEVSHQYDYLGRLCALLSPYGVQGLAAD